MSYFKSFPRTEINNNRIVDITVRIDIINKIKDNVSLFEFIQINDHATPEDVAYEKYNDPELYWIILLMNDIIDPFYDWILPETRLREYVVRKYGASKVDSVHHYETTSENSLGEGIWVDRVELNTKPVSNLSYERSLNEKKRKIKLLKVEYIPQLLAEYTNVLRDIE